MPEWQLDDTPENGAEHVTRTWEERRSLIKCSGLNGSEELDNAGIDEELHALGYCEVALVPN